MAATALALVVLSAFVHAGWNLVSKNRDPSLAFFLLASVAGFLLLSPSLILFGPKVLGALSPALQLNLALSSLSMSIYYGALAYAYREGEMSIAYPLARAAAVVLVPLVSLVLGRGDRISTQCLVGMALIMVGCTLIPLPRFRDLRPRTYGSTACVMALLAAVGTTGYSVLDDITLGALRRTLTPGLGVTALTLTYACLEVLAVSLWLGLFVGIRASGRMQLRKVVCRDARHAVAAGLGIQLAYSLVLISLAFVPDVSYVVGLRQLSVPLGAGLGIVALREPAPLPKVTGITVLVAGLALVATG
jgi:drug/metabolite transporter (DMT)-like permease